MPNSDLNESLREANASFKYSYKDTLKKVYELIEKLVSLYFTGALIICLIISMCIEVLIRWTLNISILGLPETVEMGIIVITFISLATVQKAHGHIKMDSIINQFKNRRAGRVMQFFNSLLSTMLFILITYILASFTLVAYKVGHVTMNIYLPRWPSYFLATLGSFMMSIRLIIQMIEQFTNIFRKTPKLQ